MALAFESDSFATIDVTSLFNSFLPLGNDNLVIYFNFKKSGFPKQRVCFSNLLIRLQRTFLFPSPSLSVADLFFRLPLSVFGAGNPEFHLGDGPGSATLFYIISCC